MCYCSVLEQHKKGGNMKKTCTARLYKTDVEYIKTHCNNKIADVVSALFWGSDAKLEAICKPLVEDYLERKIKPYVEDVIAKIQAKI